MSASELDGLEALMFRVLPDPKGYMERVLLELVARLDPRAEQLLTPQSADAIPGTPLLDEAELKEDKNFDLACALGACECWGENPACPECKARGSSAWLDPDPVLFRKYVLPAVKRMTSRGRHPSSNTSNATSDEGERK